MLNELHKSFSADDASRALALAERKWGKPQLHPIPSPPVVPVPVFEPVWHVVYSRPQAEVKARDDLKDAGLHVFLPMAKRWGKSRHCKSARKIEISRPAFPRYLFVGLNPSRPEWQAIRDGEHVESVLCNDGAPIRVPTRMIDGLRTAEKMGQLDDADLPSMLKAGDLVTLSSGLLQGYVGIVYRPPSSRRNSEAEIDILNRRVKVPVDNLAILDAALAA